MQECTFDGKSPIARMTFVDSHKVIHLCRECRDRILRSLGMAQLIEILETEEGQRNKK